MALGGHELFGCGANGNKSAIPPFPAFKITVRYENMIGKVYDDTFSLDVLDFSKMGAPAVAPEYVIAEMLKKIEGHLAKLLQRS